MKVPPQHRSFLESSISREYRKDTAVDTQELKLRVEKVYPSGNSFIGTVLGGVTRQQMAQLHGKICVSVRALGLDPEDVAMYQSDPRADDHFMPGHSLARVRKSTKPRKKRTVSEANLETHRLAEERIKQFTPKLRDYYERGVNRKQVRLREHVSQEFLSKVEKATGINYPVPYGVRFIKGDQFKYYHTAVEAMAERNDCSLYMISHNLVPGYTVEKGHWVDTKTGFKEWGSIEP